MRCSVKSGNERNPCRQLPSVEAGDSGGTARVKREEGADDVKSVWLLRLGLQTCYNGRYNGMPGGDAERIPKAGPSSDRRLQPASVKPELLVIADQHAAVNTFPGLVHTARHTTRVVCTRSRRPNPSRGGGVEGVEGEGGEVVTR